ncbi:hypothetical protein DFP72DRAFT_1069342 [Ephemerocybe angulata]|uniref:CFEM domain-containing protein n=1 Tax=Ephemerocybe angulata TaxID=980116 RepID=A0A8H6HWV2_9AGAR|nr:hypothetical protein DFP72DRAFT_1069342 [Tulosesus angulatus]
MLFANIFVALAAAAAVSAQGDISPCVLACAKASVKANNCKSITDFACICANPQFAVDTNKCETDNCKAPGDQAIAQQYFRAECAAAFSPLTLLYLASVTAKGTAGPAKSLSVSIPQTASTATTASPPATFSNGKNNASSVGKMGGWAVAVFAAAAFGVAL